jgi:hypothetical protein
MRRQKATAGNAGNPVYVVRAQGVIRVARAKIATTASTARRKVVLAVSASNSPQSEVRRISDMQYPEIIAAKLQQAGWTCDCWTTFSANIEFFVVDAHCGDGRRLIVQSDQKLSAFLELERLAEAATTA